MLKEEEILEKVFWPHNKKNISGSLIFSNSIDFVDIVGVDISRNKEKIEINYNYFPLFIPHKKNFSKVIL